VQKARQWVAASQALLERVRARARAHGGGGDGRPPGPQLFQLFLTAVLPEFDVDRGCVVEGRHFFLLSGLLLKAELQVNGRSHIVCGPFGLGFAYVLCVFLS
jgi:hypothetical protein